MALNIPNYINLANFQDIYCTSNLYGKCFISEQKILFYFIGNIIIKRHVLDSFGGPFKIVSSDDAAHWKLDEISMHYRLGYQDLFDQYILAKEMVQSLMF